MGGHTNTELCHVIFFSNWLVFMVFSLVYFQSLFISVPFGNFFLFYAATKKWISIFCRFFHFFLGFRELKYHFPLFSVHPFSGVKQVVLHFLVFCHFYSFSLTLCHKYYYPSTEAEEFFLLYLVTLDLSIKWPPTSHYTGFLSIILLLLSS